ncbi:26S protease regulatory subunit, partial [archaeon]
MGCAVRAHPLGAGGRPPRSWKITLFHRLPRHAYVQMIRDAFDLAKEKSKDRGGAIIFIDEIDAIGMKRSDGDQSGEREVQRTMLELLNQLDGFTANDRVKVIAATNRPDVLDPALLRSGRLDRKVELPLPDEKARMRILQIHSRKMTVDKEGTWCRTSAAH